ncbi:hypothetical protein ACTQ54_01325 [Fundicoccus sp. Sow4_H7]|uniref:hypothetical protein n=1 Tax=Fundicoccus sp. Sow4_H7 TaxID=3438784 RepID=UPI003F8E7A60
MFKKWHVFILSIVLLFITTFTTNHVHAYFLDVLTQVETIQLATGYLDLGKVDKSFVEFSTNEKEDEVIIRNNGTIEAAVFLRLETVTNNNKFYSKIYVNQQSFTQLNQNILLKQNNLPQLLAPGQEIKLKVSVAYPMEIDTSEEYQLTIGLVQTNLVNQFPTTNLSVQGFNDVETMGVKLTANEKPPVSTAWPTEAEFKQAISLNSDNHVYVFHRLLFGVDQSNGNGTKKTIIPGKMYIKLPANPIITFTDQQLIQNVFNSFNSNYRLEVKYHKNLGFELDIYLKDGLTGSDNEAMFIHNEDILLSTGQYNSSTHIKWSQYSDFAQPLILNTDISQSGPGYVSLKSDRTITSSPTGTVHTLYLLAKDDWETYAAAVTENLSNYLTVETTGPFAATLLNNKLSIRQTNSGTDKNGTVRLRSKLTGAIVLERVLKSVKTNTTSSFDVPSATFTKLDNSTSVYVTALKVEQTQTTTNSLLRAQRVASKQIVDVYLKFDQALSENAQISFEQLPAGYQLVDVLVHDNQKYIKATFSVAFNEINNSAVTEKASMKVKIVDASKNLTQSYTVYFNVVETIEKIEESTEESSAVSSSESVNESVQSNASSESNDESSLEELKSTESTAELQESISNIESEVIEPVVVESQDETESIQSEGEVTE